MTVVTERRSRVITSAPVDEQAQLDATIERLRGTKTGREVAEYLANGHADMEILDDQVFMSRYPGAGAVYDGRKDTIFIPRSAFRYDNLITTVAHEGKHALDKSTHHWAIDSLLTMGAGAEQAARGVMHLRNPLTEFANGASNRFHQDEMRAYELQAQVAQELGMNESSWSLGQAADGSPLPRDQILRNIEREPLYRMPEEKRALLSGLMGVAMTMTAAMVTSAIARRVLPADSWLATSKLPHYALSGTVVGAMFLDDRLRSRQPVAEA